MTFDTVKQPNENISDSVITVSLSLCARLLSSCHVQMRVKYEILYLRLHAAMDFAYTAKTVPNIQSP